MKSESLLVVGSANMDMVVSTEAFPKPGETLLGKSFDMYPGGKGANQAVCSAKLGCKTYFLGRLGEDIFRDKLYESMQINGVDLQYLLTDAHSSTGVAIVLVDGNGENEIIVTSGSNMTLSPKDVRANKSLFSYVSVVLTQLEIPLETVLESAMLAKENQTTFILNPAPACSIPDKLLEQTDFITPNESELELLSSTAVSNGEDVEKAARVLISRGVKNVIVTLGEKGAMWVTANGSKEFPTKKVCAVDTTAAGDAFNGALGCCLAMGHSVEKAIHNANLVASYSVRRNGAQPSMPTREEISKYLI